MSTPQNILSSDMSSLLNMMKKEFEKQTIAITNSVSEKVMLMIDEKIKPLKEENENLKLEIQILNKKIINLENMNRKNNIIFHGIKETEKSHNDLCNMISEIFSKLNIQMESYDINKIHRIGRTNTGKIRPIIISLTTLNKKIEILKCKNKMPPNTYMTEDLSKETLMIRKELQQQVNKEKEKGNEAYIKNNKLIVIQKDKRKRDNSVSPLKSLHQGPAKPILAPAKLQKTDPFAYMRCRSHSLSEKTTSKA